MKKINFKKNKLLLILSIFIITLSSQASAEKSIESYEKTYSSLKKYESYSSSQKNQLSARSIAEDEVYSLIYDAFMNLKSSIDLSAYGMSSDEVFYIRNKVLYDYPEIFYLDYENSGYWSNGKLEFEYIDTYINVIAMKNELNNKVKNILSNIITSNMTEYQKELAIHDYIVLNTRYDEENYNNNTIPRESYTTYGTLVKGVAVCQGYAETFKLLLREVGIDSIIVSSEPMNHAWNIVNIDGESYQVDVTWNDPTPDRKGKIGYRYLNLTDSEMKKDHNWNYSNYPTSTSTKYSYMWEIDSPIIDGNYKYYSSSEDYFIYRLDENLNKQQITSVRAPYFDIAGEDIYFSNYDSGGYLFKTKKDGTGTPAKLNDKHSVDIYREGSYIYYTEKDSGIKTSIKVDIIVEEDQYNIPLDKVWTITFNKDVDINSINESTIYILDDDQNKVSLTYEVNGKKVRLIPKENYIPNKEYTIFITKGVKSENVNLKTPVEKQFSIYKTN